MPKILVKQKAEVAQEYTIPEDKTTILIGSESDNDLIIDDKKVSMNHLEISREATQFFVKDLKSAFGTILNGEPADKKMPIKHGDTIQIGQHSLIFQDNIQEEFHEEPETNEPDTDSKFLYDPLNPVKPLNIRKENGNDVQATSFNPDLDAFDSPNLKTPITPLTPRDFGKKPVNAPKVPLSNYYLLAIYGPYRGKKFQLNQSETRIGRDTKLNDIVIRMSNSSMVDSSISRRHATIRNENGNYFISDKRSKTRTYVNQHKVSETDNQLLIPGDEIEIVSDQQSTIFRLCPENNLDFAPPRKAGVWWIRFQTPIIRGVSALLLIIAIILFMRSLGGRNIVAQKPEQLNFQESVYYKQNAGNESLEFPSLHSSDNLINNPALSDINGDGLVDVVLLDPQGRVRAISGETKRPLWQTEAHIQSPGAGQVVLADINRDEIDDILLTTTTERLVAIDGKLGAEIWSSAIIGGSFSGPAVVADINSDKCNDVAIGTVNGNIICALSEMTEPSWKSFEIEDSLASVPSAGDLTGDGVDDFIFGTEAGNIFFFHGKATKTGLKIPVHEQIIKSQGFEGKVNRIRAPVSVGTLDRDYKKDIIVSTNLGNLIAINSYSKEKLWIEASSVVGEFITNMYYPTVLGDFDDDQQDDVALYTLDGRIRAIKGAKTANGSKVILWEYPPEDWENFISNPALADFNKDGVLDIVAAGVNHGLYVINGRNGKLLWKTNFQGKNPPISSPVIADLDNDSWLDVLIVRSDKNIYQYKSNCRYPEGSVVWGQRFGNAQNNGKIPLMKFSTLGYNIRILLSLLIFIGVGVVNFMLYKKQQVVSGF